MQALNNVLRNRIMKCVNTRLILYPFTVILLTETEIQIQYVILHGFIKTN